MPGGARTGRNAPRVAVTPRRTVANEQDRTLMRVDARTNVVDPPTPIRVGRAPRALATAPNAVFVANRGDGTVDRIDIKSRRVAATLKTGKRPTALVISGKFLWV